MTAIGPLPGSDTDDGDIRAAEVLIADDDDRDQSIAVDDDEATIQNGDDEPTPIVEVAGG
jgi:hypothetical protein